MAVRVFGLLALLAVFNTRVSYGAATPSTRLQLVAVQVKNLEITVERLEVGRHDCGELGLSEQRQIGIFGSGRELANGDAAAATLQHCETCYSTCYRTIAPVMHYRCITGPLRRRNESCNGKRLRRDSCDVAIDCDASRNRLRDTCSIVRNGTAI